MKQADLFDSPDPPDPLGDEAPRATYRADPARVRLKMLAVLEELRRATAMPWDARDQRYHQTVFPQMSRWLPQEEAAQLRLEFEAQFERLRAA